MSMNGFLHSTDVRSGWVKPLGSAWRPVQYAAVGERAVFEGCILLGKVAAIEAATKTLRDNANLLVPGAESEGVAIVGQQYRWPDKIIPYEIAADLPQQDRVAQAIKHWQDNTPIRFRPRGAGDENYVVFIPGDGCASSVGMQGGAQEIILGPSCSSGNAIHEIGHAVGLWHEQSRSDRDQHIEIAWENIAPAYRHNFEQRILDGMDIGPYNFGSIMHYPTDAFSSNGKPTIRTKDGSSIGQRIALSPGDIAAVNQIYP